MHEVDRKGNLCLSVNIFLIRFNKACTTDLSKIKYELHMSTN